MDRFLTGYHVLQKRVKAIAKAEGYILWPTKWEPALPKKEPKEWPDPLVIVAGELDNTRVFELLSLPLTALIDSQSMDDSIHDFVSRVRANHLKYRLAFLVTCPVIYHCDVARVFVQALNSRIHLTQNKIDGIHFALHEAIVNGFIHGNLQISNNYRQDVRSFAEYGRLLAERLQDASYARKSISISATWDDKKLAITIKDEGAGYVIKDEVCCRPMPDIYSKTGRGLLFIAGISDSCTIDDYGRQITLTFDLQGAETHHDVAYMQSDTKEDKADYQRPPLDESRVLIIEDSPSNQTMLHSLLNVMGIQNIEAALDGIEGLAKVDQFNPDLIILDITMPKMSGYEVLHKLKNNSQTRDIPVLIETASDTREARDKTFRTGATDFITKPINPLEFFSRVRTQLENRSLIKHLKRQLSQIDEELASAQKMQEMLLPSKDMLLKIERRYQIAIAQHFAPSSRLGGDFWGVIPLTEKKLAFYTCDFSGHGVSAALNTFRLHALMTQLPPLSVEVPASVMAMTNAQLISLLPRGQFAAFFIGVVDFGKNTMTYASAGTPKPILIMPDGQVEHLTANAMPLGISKQAIYDNTQIHFPVGAKLILYSDALTESPNAHGDRLGEEGFEKLVMQQLPCATADTVVQGIINAFFDFVPPPPPDDVTLIYLERKE